MCTVILAYIHPQCLEHFVSQLARPILDDLYVLSSVSGKLGSYRVVDWVEMNFILISKLQKKFRRAEI